MKTSVKYLLMFILLLSFSMRGNALNIDDSSVATCQVSESAKNAVSASLDSDDVAFYNRLHALSISDVELGFKPISEQEFINADSQSKTAYNNPSSRFDTFKRGFFLSSFHNQFFCFKEFINLIEFKIQRYN